jgi:hypothetical protein
VERRRKVDVPGATIVPNRPLVLEVVESHVSAETVAEFVADTGAVGVAVAGFLEVVGSQLDADAGDVEVASPHHVTGNRAAEVEAAFQAIVDIGDLDIGIFGHVGRLGGRDEQGRQTQYDQSQEFTHEQVPFATTTPVEWDQLSAHFLKAHLTLRLNPNGA